MKFIRRADFDTVDRDVYEVREVIGGRVAHALIPLPKGFSPETDLSLKIEMAFAVMNAFDDLVRRNGCLTKPSPSL